MVELQEIKIGDNEIVLNDNLVKTSILPESAKELSRDIKIQGNVIVEGAVFGNDISIKTGNVTFNGAVFANDELYINSDISEQVTFKKAAASADTITAFVTSSRVIFGADVNAVSVKLKNCFIAGSVFGTDIYLENCVVLGGVFASTNAVISNCIVGTFNAPSVELAGIDYLLYPAAFTVEPLTFLPQTELYNLALAHLGALYKGEKEAEFTGKIKMSLESDNQRTVLVGDNDEMTIVNSYSVSDRVLASDIINLDKLENHFLIGAGALNTQILKAYSLTKEDGTKTEELSLDNIAGFFFSILSGTITVQDASGEISFETLKKSFDGQRFNGVAEYETREEVTKETVSENNPEEVVAAETLEPSVEMQANESATVYETQETNETPIMIPASEPAVENNEMSQAVEQVSAPEPPKERTVKYCSNCGTPNEIDAAFCGHCGTAFSQK